MRTTFVSVLVPLVLVGDLLGNEGRVFSYADISIGRRFELRPRSREVSEAEAAGNVFFSELRKAKARIVTDATGAIVEIQFSELDTEALSDEAIRSFRKLTSLRCLSIRAPQLIRQLVAEISSLPVLEELGLCTVSPNTVHRLSKAPALSRLWLEDTRFDGETAGAIAKLPHLSALHLDDCKYPAGIDSAFVPMPRLKSLEISGGVLNGPHPLRCLESFPELECLWISSIWCNREAMQRIGGLTKLEELSLQYVELNDEMLRELGTLSKMRRAILANTTDLTGEGLRHLGTWRDLEELSVFTTSFDDGGVRNLSQFPELKKFVAYETFITDASIDALMKARKLKLAWLGRSKITAAGMERLRKELPECEIRLFTQH